MSGWSARPMDGWTKVPLDYAGVGVSDRTDGLRQVEAWLAAQGVAWADVDLGTDIRIEQWHVKGRGHPHEYIYWVRDVLISPS